MRMGSPMLRAFGAALSLAVGLMASPAATAAQLTYDDPYCSRFFTVPGSTGGDVILQCVPALPCSITTDTSYIVPSGTQVTMTVSCANPVTQAPAWSLGIRSPQGCPAPAATASPNKVTVTSTTSRVCWYEVIATDSALPPNQGLTRYGIVWTDPAPSGCTASVPATSLPSTGGPVSLTGACTTGPVTSWSWTRNSTVFSSAQNPTDNLPANTTSSSISYTYALTACNGISCAAPVTATPGPVTVAAAPVPSGCTITPTPSNASLPSTGGNISMTVACTAGGPFTAFNWRKNTTTFGTNTATQNDTLQSNPNATPVQTTYDVQVCNSAGCATRVSQVFTVAGVTVSATMCSQYNNVIQVDLPTGSPDQLVTQTYGGFMSDGVFVGRFTAAASSATANGQLNWAEYGDPPTYRLVTLSTQPCDFRGEGVWSVGDGTNYPLRWSGGQTGGIEYTITPEAGNPMLQIGQVYYINIRNRDFFGINTCGLTSCNMIVQHVVAH